MTASDKLRAIANRIGFALFCIFVATIFLLFAVGIGLTQFLDQEPQRHGVRR